MGFLRFSLAYLSNLILTGAVVAALALVMGRAPHEMTVLTLGMVGMGVALRAAHRLLDLWEARGG